jgi:hypothetical protein
LFVDDNRAVVPANGDPNIGTYRYKMAIKDICGNVGSLSPYHNSVYFIDLQTGTFIWNTYDVESASTPVNNFILMVDTNNTNYWKPIGSVAGTQTTLNDPRYFNYQTIANWRVEATGLNCTPMQRQDHNNTLAIVKAKSNIKNNRTTEINNSIGNKITLYPNPTNGALYLHLAYNGKAPTLELYTLLGEKVFSSPVSEASSSVDLKQLPAGMYEARIVEKGEVIFLSKIVKQ